MIEQQHIDVIAAKFCNIAATPDKKKECLALITNAIVSGNPDFTALSEITGKDADELITILTKSCPMCPTASESS